MSKKQKMSFAVRTLISLPLLALMGFPIPLIPVLVIIEYFGEKWLLSKGLNVPFM